MRKSNHRLWKEGKNYSVNGVGTGYLFKQARCSFHSKGQNKFQMVQKCEHKK